MKRCYSTACLWLEFGRLHTRKLALPLLMGPTLALAQQTVKGTVTDEKNAALPGVTVRIKDGTAAVASNPMAPTASRPPGPLIFWCSRLWAR